MIALIKKSCFVLFSLSFFIVGNFAFAEDSAALNEIVLDETSPQVAAENDKKLPADKMNDDTISLDFKDADINTVLRVLSIKSGMNIVTGPEVGGLVTVRLDNVPWEKALDVILRTYDYVFERDENIIRITTRDKMELEPVDTKTFILNYSKANEIQSAVQDILTERGKIKVAQRTNMVVVTDIPTNLYKIGEIIARLDQLTPQAYIDSKIIKTGTSVVENMGIKWNPTVTLTGSSRPTTFPFTNDDKSASGWRSFFPQLSDAGGSTTTTSTASTNPSRSSAFPLAPVNTNDATFNYGTLDFSSFSATLQMLRQSSTTKMISNPRVVVLNNQTAHIQVGQDFPIPKFERNETTGSMVVSGYDYRQLGVVLNVTPHINSAAEILVDLKPEISSQGGMVDFIAGQLSAPSFTVTNAETQVLIASGQTIAIGGLMTDEFGMEEAKVPYLSDIPLLGKLFRSKRQETGNNSKVETLFFVTVTMVDSQGQPAVSKVDGDNNPQQTKENLTSRDTAETGAGGSTQTTETQAIPNDADKV